MSRRIDIELTSSRDDGTWTWRAAGAKQPKGALAGSLLPDGAAVGDVLKAEVETSIDGTEVMSVASPKAKKRNEAERIELVSRSLSDDELVIQTLAPKRGRGDRGDRGGRGDRRDRRDRGDRGDRGDRRGRDGDRPGGPRGDRDRGRGRDGERGGDDRRDRPRRDRPAPPPKPKAKRLRAGRAHRKVALEALAPEEQVIAEQVLRGGIPAVRQAVERMNEQAKAEGRPEVKPDALVAVAERLLPALRAAEWRDRAEAAAADLDELDLRDLRSVVVAADQAAKDDDARELASQLRDGLTRRVDQEQQKWLDELAETLAEGRVVRALRLSSRPPKAGHPLPAELATALTEAASAALTADTPADRWATVLDALSYSPVRLQVTPASKPDAPAEELTAVITRIASRVPKVAEAFGVAAPADEPRRRGRGPRRGPKPPRGPKGEGAAAPDAKADAPAPSESPAATEDSSTAPDPGPGPETTLEPVSAPAADDAVTAEADAEADAPAPTEADAPAAPSPAEAEAESPAEAQADAVATDDAAAPAPDDGDPTEAS